MQTCRSVTLEQSSNLATSACETYDKCSDRIALGACVVRCAIVCCKVLQSSARETHYNAVAGLLLVKIRLSQSWRIAFSFYLYII